MSEPFDIILADPPWKFASNSAEKPGRNPRRHYPCMTDAEIMALPVSDWAAKSALLVMWTTVPMLERSMPVLRAWGFRYKSQLVWVKDKIGTGYWARNRHEIALIATRGRFPLPDRAPFPDSVIEAPRREHSRKPDALHHLIEAAWPDAKRLEMFAREQRRGWWSWGNDTSKFNEAVKKPLTAV
jgi:N6-adenosine-specific RNA methylase IME4